MGYDWDMAEKHLQTAEGAYAAIGAAGLFALSNVIQPIRARFDSGERTDAMFDDIMGISL